jgi:predicted DNA-binding protein
MERINLNIPNDLRKRLKRIAQRSKKPESVVARELLQEGLEARERSAFYRNVTETQTVTVSERDSAVLDAFEGFDDESR